MKNTFPKHFGKAGFTLIEVVLALGVFLVSVLALVGLLGPMIQSVDNIEKMDEITSVVHTVDAFLQNSPDIAIRDGTPSVVTKTKFNAIYEALSTTNGNEATVFVYRYYDDTDPDKEQIRLEVGFSPDENTDGEIVGADSIVNEPNSNPASFNQAVGPIFRVVLSVSPVTPLLPVPLRTPTRDPGTGIYALTESVDNYPEGSLALEARIFAEDPPGPVVTFDTTTDLTQLNSKEPDFTFNTAIVR